MILLNSTDIQISAGQKRLSYFEEYLQKSIRDKDKTDGISLPNATERDEHVGSYFTTSQPIVNPHDFRYVINPATICQGQQLKYVVYIHSAPSNFKKRQTIRQTWGSKALMVKHKMMVVFVMGLVPETVTMQRVKYESNRYGDIVVEDFTDTYRNLTYKAIGGLKWVSTYCAQATYVIKSDDDILIDVEKLMYLMTSPEVISYGTKRVIMCNKWTKMKVIRDKNSKWYISVEEFSSEYFPPYCSGSVFVMSTDVAVALYQASFYTKFFWVDDFYITGMLVQSLKLEHKPLNDHYMLNAREAVQKFKEDDKQVKVGPRSQ
ncbi:hypothetical protein DPMN_000446 [Dreissena polymorpha]|uniref:Hexosyltransferase n=1 Tax=Dreissena polymorpha TaxID=45954 RepID=A0A9D4RPY0_DREPO|nr:hypothetical protein DPMN_000446 [Dreissena polymorpha]